jgi:threonine dehydratase
VGGGLTADVATAFSGPDSDGTVLGVETVGTAHAGRAIDRDEVVVREEIGTIAEGITAGRTEPLALAPLRERVDEVVSVSDEAAKEAMAVLVARANTVAEPAGARPVAAVLSGADDVAEKRVVAVIAGGNVDLADFCESATAGERNLSVDG